MKIDNNMSEIFDLEPVEKVTGEVITKSGEVILPPDDRVDYDYDKSRSNLHNLLQQGQDALNHALEVAKSSEHPRAFEVVGNLMKQLADINHQLMDLHGKKRILDAPSKNEAAKQVTNNNAIFVGSTAELSKLIDNMNKGV
jgi:hypothetical protein